MIWLIFFFMNVFGCILNAVAYYQPEGDGYNAFFCGWAAAFAITCLAIFLEDKFKCNS